METEGNGLVRLGDLSEVKVGQFVCIRATLVGLSESYPLGRDALNAWLKLEGSSVTHPLGIDQSTGIDGRTRLTVQAKGPESMGELVRILKDAERFNIAYQDLMARTKGKKF
ncbi:hypothetical protein JW766_01285 [Candidatus Dojkabacteria bacterium]|nr:hypothetical protein [Candidatus Dojkabacteria bacterium]